MPTSGWQNLTELMRLIVMINPAEVLDVGAGTGKYGFLCREYLDIAAGRVFKGEWKVRIDGIEIFEKYLSPVHQYVYDSVIIGDFTEWIRKLDRKYDLVLCVGVLEHFPKEQGTRILEDFRRLAKKAVLVNVPYGMYKQAPCCGNPAEEHKAYWYVGDFKRCGYMARVVRDRNINAVWLAPAVDARWGTIDRIKDALTRKLLRLQRSRLGRRAAMVFGRHRVRDQWR